MASGHTEQYQLNQWEANDLVVRTDFNADNLKIEAALAQLEEDKASLSVVDVVARSLGQLRTQVNELEDLVESLRNSP